MSKKFLSEQEVCEIEARCLKASPGPWTSYIEGRDHESGCSFIMRGVGSERMDDIELSGATAADQDFIASARQDIPALVAEIRSLRALLDLKADIRTQADR